MLSQVTQWPGVTLIVGKLFYMCDVQQCMQMRIRVLLTCYTVTISLDFALLEILAFMCDNMFWVYLGLSEVVLLE